MSETFVTPIGRLVGGHPMKRNAVTRKNPATQALEKVMQADGVTPATSMYIGVAIPKNPGVDWKQEPWGQYIVNIGNAAWPNGQSQSPTFAWKITDGDSAVPNKNGVVPNQKEGYPGHWVINMSTRFFVKCYHAGKYDPMTDQIQNEQEIKPGDYCRVCFEAAGNGSNESPGVYINPSLFELSRPGDLIVLEGGPSAMDAFGGGQPGMPPAGQPGMPPAGQPGMPPAGQPGMPPAGQPGMPPAPAPDFLQGPKQVNVNGQVFTVEQLKQAGWADEQIAAASVPF